MPQNPRRYIQRNEYNYRALRLPDGSLFLFDSTDAEIEATIQKFPEIAWYFFDTHIDANMNGVRDDREPTNVEGVLYDFKPLVDELELGTSGINALKNQFQIFVNAQSQSNGS